MTKHPVTEVPSREGALVESRKKAVNSILYGSITAGIGVAGLGVGWFESSSPVPFGSVIFGVGLLGIGLILTGRAVTHFARYGNTRAALISGTVLGLGVSSVLMIQRWIPLGLQTAATFASGGFALLLVLLVIGALVGWVRSDE